MKLPDARYPSQPGPRHVRMWPWLVLAAAVLAVGLVAIALA